MRIKQDVRLDNLCPQMLMASMVVWQVCREVGIACVVTSGSEAIHSVGSLHPLGHALDFRTRYLSSEKVREDFSATVRERLTADFDVILEATHLHVEYQQRCRA